MHGKKKEKESETKAGKKEKAVDHLPDRPTENKGSKEFFRYSLSL